MRETWLFGFDPKDRTCVQMPVEKVKRLRARGQRIVWRGYFHTDEKAVHYFKNEVIGTTEIVI